LYFTFQIFFSKVDVEEMLLLGNKAGEDFTLSGKQRGDLDAFLVNVISKLERSKESIAFFHYLYFREFTTHCS